MSFFWLLLPHPAQRGAITHRSPSSGVSGTGSLASNKYLESLIPLQMIFTKREVITYAYQRKLLEGRTGNNRAVPAVPNRLQSREEHQTTTKNFLFRHRISAFHRTISSCHLLPEDRLLSGSTRRDQWRCNAATTPWSGGRYAESLRRLNCWPFGNAIARLTEKNPNPYDGEAFYNLGLAPKNFREKKDDGAYDSFYKSCWNAAWQDAGKYSLGPDSSNWEEAEARLNWRHRATLSKAIYFRHLRTKREVCPDRRSPEDGCIQLRRLSEKYPITRDETVLIQPGNPNETWSTRLRSTGTRLYFRCRTI